MEISPFYEEKLQEIRKLILISGHIDTSFKRIEINWEEGLRRDVINKIIVRLKEIIDEMGLNADG